LDNIDRKKEKESELHLVATKYKDTAEKQRKSLSYVHSSIRITEEKTKNRAFIYHTAYKVVAYKLVAYKIPGVLYGI